MEDQRQEGEAGRSIPRIGAAIMTTLVLACAMAMLRTKAGGSIVGTSTHSFQGKDEVMESLLGSLKGLKKEDIDADAAEAKEELEDMLAKGPSGGSDKDAMDKLENNAEAMAFLGALAGEETEGKKGSNPLEGLFTEALKEGDGKSESPDDAIAAMAGLMESGGHSEEDSKAAMEALGSLAGMFGGGDEQRLLLDAKSKEESKQKPSEDAEKPEEDSKKDSKEDPESKKDSTEDSTKESKKDSKESKEEPTEKPKEDSKEEPTEKPKEEPKEDSKEESNKDSEEESKEESKEDGGPLAFFKNFFR